MIVAAAEKDVKDKYGDVTDEEYFSSLFKDGPTLCGQTCAWLATGKGKELRGLFIGKHASQCDETVSYFCSQIQTVGRMLLSCSNMAGNDY